MLQFVRKLKRNHTGNAFYTLNKVLAGLHAVDCELAVRDTVSCFEHRTHLYLDLPFGLLTFAARPLFD